MNLWSFSSNVQSSHQLILILDAIVKKWDSLYTGEKDDYPVHGSIGAVMTNGSENFHELYRRADTALYKAKRSGKGGYASMPLKQKRKNNTGAADSHPICAPVF